MKTVIWQEKKGDLYVVTGVDRKGRRFKLTTDRWLHAKAINVWRGTRWLLRDGKRKRIESISN